MEIKIDSQIRNAAPELRELIIEADVTNPATPDSLWQEIEAAAEEIRRTYAMEDIRHRPAIAGTRYAYKALGKEPNRYRPSAEALCRRIVKGMDLYRSDTLVDLVNLLSLVSGHSIGGFDADKIEGPSLTLGAGREGEPYEAIDRGPLNICGLPVFRDSVGGIGTPTSDNERTKLTSGTRRFLMTVNIYREGDISADETLEMARRLLTEYADAKNIRVQTL